MVYNSSKFKLPQRIHALTRGWHSLRQKIPSLCPLCNARIRGPGVCSSCRKLMQPALPLCLCCAEPLATHPRSNTIEATSAHVQRFDAARTGTDAIPPMDAVTAAPARIDPHPTASSMAPEQRRSVQEQRCGQCQQHPPQFNRTFVTGLYQEPLSRLIKALKFHARLDAAEILVQLFTQQSRVEQHALPDALVPVPLHWWRHLRRGFNQANQIALLLGRHYNLPVLNHLARRIRATDAQSHSNLALRKRNVRGCFELNQTELPRHVAIVDDVITSGSTCNELARVLRRGGVTTVDVWCMAKTP